MVNGISVKREEEGKEGGIEKSEELNICELWTGLRWGEIFAWKTTIQWPNEKSNKKDKCR